MLQRLFLAFALLASATALLWAAVAAKSLLATRPAADPCALPGGVTLDGLDANAHELAVRRAMACVDLRHGRIAVHEYRMLLRTLDALPRPALVDAPPPAPAHPAVQWASRVRSFSTQYTETEWSAQQVLGPPDVYPSRGDNPKAWASLGADDRREWLEVGFEKPQRIAGVVIHETDNPGAIDRVTLITTSGRTVQAPINTLSAFGCTSDPIMAVRVDLDSPRHSGWNEIDAIGVIPCQ